MLFIFTCLQEEETVFGISRHRELSGCRALSRALSCIITNASGALQRIPQLSAGTHLAAPRRKRRSEKGLGDKG